MSAALVLHTSAPVQTNEAPVHLCNGDPYIDVRVQHACTCGACARVQLRGCTDLHTSGWRAGGSAALNGKRTTRALRMAATRLIAAVR